MTQATVLNPVFETIVGVECHVELLTESKVFCSCRAEFGGEPNTHVCPICLGLPGTLPVLNERVLELATRAALALNCEIARYTKFDRKNYMYPDLPKGYQISQYDLPLGKGGWIDIPADGGGTKRVRIKRLHMEEDTGKSLHGGSLVGATSSLVDFNRAGVPLIEIVTEPDMRSPEEVKAYLDRLKSILEYTEVSDVKMEQGSLRAEANVNVVMRGRDAATGEEVVRKTAIVELKNINSFRNVLKALNVEVERHRAMLERGETGRRETRGWDEARQTTVPLRTKEEAHDYRYFPEPDLPPYELSAEWIEDVRKGLPELPHARHARFVAEYGLSDYDAGVLVASRKVADWFEEAVRLAGDAKAVANWTTGELFKYQNARGLATEDIPLEPLRLAQLIRLVQSGTITGTVAKQVFETVCETGKDPEEIVREQGLAQISDESAIRDMVAQVIAQNEKVVADYRGGKETALGFLVGQVMRLSRGKANPGLVQSILREALKD